MFVVISPAAEIGGNLTWRNAGGHGLPWESAVTASLGAVVRGISRADKLFAWSPPEGAIVVGQGHVRAGFLFQPCFRVVTDAYTDYESAACERHKVALYLAKISLADPEDWSWIDASPVPATVDAKYNSASALAALNWLKETSVWGAVSDGGEYLGTVFTAGLAIPRFSGAHSVYAINLDTGSRVWQSLGWSGYPVALASLPPDYDPFEVGSDPSRPDLNFSSDNWTVLGPGRPGYLLVHRLRRDWAPSIGPDWQAPYTTPVYDWANNQAGVANLAANWATRWKWGRGYGSWSWETIVDGFTSSFCSVFTDFGNGYMINGSPLQTNYFRPNSPWPVVPGTHQTQAEALARGPEACLAEAIELGYTTRYLGQVPYKIEEWLDEIRLSDGVVTASLQNPDTCLTEERNCRGYGTAQQLSYSTTEMGAWPLHPEDPSGPTPGSWTPDLPWRKHLHPPENRLEGYVGGSWLERGAGPISALATQFTGSTETPFPPSATSLNNSPRPWWLLSMDTGAVASIGQAPVGIGVATQSNGSPVTSYDVIDRVYVTWCYTQIAPGAEGSTERPLPLPFDPLVYASDGRRAIFVPRANGQVWLQDTRQSRNLGPDVPHHTLPEWDAEVARQHRVVCYSLGPVDETDEAPPTWTPLWSLDVRGLVGGTLLSNGRENPGAGDRVSTPILQDGILTLTVRGASGQRRIEIEAATGTVISNVQESALTGLADTPWNPVRPGEHLHFNHPSHYADNSLTDGRSRYGMAEDTFWKESQSG